MFCQVNGKEFLGIGKIISVDSNIGCVEYFLSPTEECQKVKISKNKIAVVSLCPQTRIYYKNPDTGLWKIGRVLDGEGDLIHVQFPNREILNIHAEDIYVRCDTPISDPTSYLSKFLNETPLFANSRRKFVKNFLNQRRVSKGMSGLLSSVIELERHQVQVVERILKDPIQRYLLADEVGLGKTIEAGVVIRQYVLDFPEEHSIVIVVPPNLVSQWREELSRRFLLDYCHGESIFIVPNDDLVQLKSVLSKAKMLVVDEVHQIVTGLDLDKPSQCYQLICQSSHQVDKLLLLSATPVLGNEASFLAMLHLLDPIAYPLSGLKTFHKKIENRQPLAHLIAEFSPDNLFFLGDSLDQLTKMFPDDALLNKHALCLQELLEDAPIEADATIISAIDTIRSHISETYKLHRRILRNRRSEVEGLTPERLGFKIVGYQSSERSTVVNLLEQWRSEATLSVYGSDDGVEFVALKEIFLSFLGALFCSPKELELIIAKRMTEGGRQDETRTQDLWQIPFFPDEEQILKRLVSSTKDLINDQSKLRALVGQLTKLVGLRKKIIVFCTQSETADFVASGLEVHLPGNVVRHVIDGDGESGLEDFLTKTQCNVLVCDKSSEEGLNLHGGKKVMVHFDLPISPNRIEQRIGRLDRYGSGGGIHNYGLVCEDDIFEQEWSRCLDEGFEVFERSIASLQYLIDEEIQGLKGTLFSHGVEALHELIGRLGGADGLLASELTKIKLQDQLDSIYEEETESFYELEEYDDEWKKISRQIDSWVEQCLMFSKINYHIEEPFPPDYVFRWQYNHDTKRNTLLPLNSFITNFLPSIDFVDSRSTSKKPLSFPFSYRRQTAVSKHVHLLRYGNPFINGVMEFTSQDDRGKSFAVWRSAPDYESKEDMDHFFRFDFIVETDLDPVLKACKNISPENVDTMIHAIRRQGDIALTPLYQTVWLDAEFEAPDNETLLEYLEVGYQKHPRENNGSRDKNINSTRWEWMWGHFPLFRNWEDVCSAARSSALNSLRERTNLDEVLQSSLEKFQSQDEKHFSQIKSRLTSLTLLERNNEEQELADQILLRLALGEGIASPKITIDSVGVVFLSDFMPSFE